jgi:putative transcriptional regulator
LEGIAALKGHREGKLTLRKKLRCPRAVFARQLRINVRTLEKWEQGRAKPNPQAAALVLLVRRFPDTLQRLETLATG